jgi:hypothetical protein
VYSNLSSQLTDTFFCQKISFEMKHGVVNVIRKANDRVCNGNSGYPHDPRKLPYRNHKWSQCLSLSSISRVLFTLNSFHKSRQSTELIMWEYWSGYMKLCEENGVNLAQRLDYPPWQCASTQGALWQTSFWSKNRLLKWNTHPYSPDLSANDFWLFP